MGRAAFRTSCTPLLSKLSSRKGAFTKTALGAMAAMTSTKSNGIWSGDSLYFVLISGIYLGLVQPVRSPPLYLWKLVKPQEGTAALMRLSKAAVKSVL